MKKSFLLSIGAGIVGFIAGICVKKESKSENTASGNDKYMLYFSLLDRWMKLKERGKTLEGYFIKHGYHKIGIYGIAHLGNHLIAELSNSEIEVAYGIDRRADLIYAGIPVWGLDDEWDCVDAIIVTPIYDYASIKKEIEKRGGYKVISLEEVVHESM